ncbi:hypothetical protein EB796_012890 [Bugula neritina]|uniref:EGF-like domain-containing protein n=1 Tax=Bugula neritina TaxID=10212 RepID=A0A7J7JT41_BUGNE|nr:hypothetical protein EB796_012890 [Bugula neritina]
MYCSLQLSTVPVIVLLGACLRSNAKPAKDADTTTASTVTPIISNIDTILCTRNESLLKSCLNNGTCYADVNIEDQTSTLKCHCPTNFTGTRCEKYKRGSK